MPFDIDRYVKAYFDTNKIKYYTKNGATWIKVDKNMVRIQFDYGRVHVEFPMIYRKSMTFNNGVQFISWYEEETKK